MDLIHGVDRNIPKITWARLVNTSTRDFRSIVKTMVSDTSNVGRLVNAKFNDLIESEKILIAENMKCADKKARAQITLPKPNPSTIIKFIDASKNETDISLRELWSNLIANDMLGKRVHPLFIDIFSKLSPQDMLILLQIGANSDDSQVKESAQALLKKLELTDLVLPFFIEEDNLHTHILTVHGLINKSGSLWQLTKLGEAFLSVIAEPNERF